MHALACCSRRPTRQRSGGRSTPFLIRCLLPSLLHPSSHHCRQQQHSPYGLTRASSALPPAMAWFRAPLRAFPRPRCPRLRSCALHTQRSVLADPAPQPAAASSAFPFDLSPSPLRILFFGSDHFSLRTLSLLTSPALPSSSSLSQPPSLAVVCPDAQPIGRSRPRQPVPVHTHAQQHHLPAFPVPDSVNFRMAGWEVPPCPWQGGWDVGVVVSFGYFIPQRVIQHFPLGMINLHPSLLPRYAWSLFTPIVPAACAVG